jgi:hypothetical protein
VIWLLRCSCRKPKEEVSNLSIEYLLTCCFSCCYCCLFVAISAAASQEEEGNAARAKLQALLARKQEAANKLELLQQEIAMMANLNPAELAALEKEVGGLVAAMSAAEAKKAAMEMQVGLAVEPQLPVGQPLGTYCDE